MKSIWWQIEELSIGVKNEGVTAPLQNSPPAPLFSKEIVLINSMIFLKRGEEFYHVSRFTTIP
jgi:hypothetical protein